MTNLLAVGVWQWVVIALVGIIVFSIIMHYINRSFRIRYDLNLFWGGLLMLIVIACAVLGYFASKEGRTIGYGLLAVAAVIVIITLIYDCKKCGAMGIVAIICQILFSAGSLFILIEFFQGRKTTNYTTERYIRKKRKERDDYYGY